MDFFLYYMEFGFLKSLLCSLPILALIILAMIAYSLCRMKSPRKRIRDTASGKGNKSTYFALQNNLFSLAKQVILLINLSYFARENKLFSRSIADSTESRSHYDLFHPCCRSQSVETRSRVLAPRQAMRH